MLQQDDIRVDPAANAPQAHPAAAGQPLPPDAQQVNPVAAAQQANPLADAQQVNPIAAAQQANLIVPQVIAAAGDPQALPDDDLDDLPTAMVTALIPQPFRGSFYDDGRMWLETVTWYVQTQTQTRTPNDRS